MSRKDPLQTDMVKSRELNEPAPSLAMRKEKNLIPEWGEGDLRHLKEQYGKMIRLKENSSVYTPSELAAELFEQTLKFMPKEASILDCSCGTGNLAAPFQAAGFSVDLMDTDEMALTLARMDHPDASIFQEDFLEAQGKWDVIIGNPPYKGHKTMTAQEKSYLKIRFGQVMDNKADLYYAFFQKGWETLEEGGILSYIVSRYWLEAESAAKLRGFILSHFRILYMHDWYGVRPFGAGVDPLLIVLKKESGGDGVYRQDYSFLAIREDAGKMIVPCSEFSAASMKLRTGEEIRLRSVFRSMCEKSLGECGEFHQGIITGFDRAFIMTEKEAVEHGIERELLVPWAKSSDLGRLNEPGYAADLRRLVYAERKSADLPGFMAYIENHRERLSRRREVLQGTREFYELQWGRNRQLFEKERILFPYKASGSHFVSACGIFHSADVYSYTSGLDAKWLTALLNSPLYDRYIKTELKKLGCDLYEYYPHRLSRILIPDPLDWPDPDRFLKAAEKEFLIDESE